MFVALVGVVVGALGLTGLLSLHSSIDVVTGDAVPSLVQVTAAQGDVQTAMSNTRAIGQTNSGLQKTQFAATAMRAQTGRAGAVQGLLRRHRGQIVPGVPTCRANSSPPAALDAPRRACRKLGGGTVEGHPALQEDLSLLRTLVLPGTICPRCRRSRP